MFIRQLTYLVTIEREKHFGRAAKACNVSQPAPADHPWRRSVFLPATLRFPL